MNLSDTKPGSAERAGAVRWTLPVVLDHQVQAVGDKPCVRMVGGETLTFREVQADTARVAGLLARRDVAAGEAVAVMLPNGLDFVRAWAGVLRLGAVCVALNTELDGALLLHQLESSGARVAIVDTASLERIEVLADRLTHLDILLVAGGDVSPPPCRLDLIPFDGWRDEAPYDGPAPGPGDPAMILYTSGTTGPAKGVVMPHAHCHLFALNSVEQLGLGEADIYYIVLPLFHANGLLMQLYGAMLAGATAVVRRRFSGSAWLDDVRTHGATVTNTLGALSAFVLATPPTPQDRDHRLRLVLLAPNIAEHAQAWRERFGVAEIGATFGGTEMNIPFWTVRGLDKPGASGRLATRWFEASIRDPETDEALAAGQVGELAVRPKAPFGFMAGYHGAAEATVQAWRNLWFRTGDAGRLDEDGDFFFVDRLRDCIRRRGENISSFEVERAALGLSGVDEAAAYGVPAELGGEDEVMLAIVASPGPAPDPAALAKALDALLPPFARPRYLEVVSALEKTPTGKVRKVELRRRGVTAATYDHQGGAKAADRRTRP